MPRIDELSGAEFMNLQAEYGASLPICPICTLEDVRHLLLDLADRGTTRVAGGTWEMTAKLFRRHQAPWPEKSLQRARAAA